MALGVTVVAVSIASTAVAGLIIILRCIARFVIIRKAGADDILAILAFLCSLAATCLTYFQLPYGLGKDIKQVTFADLFMMLKYQWATLIVFGLAMTFIGTSALAQYLRFLFRRNYRILCWGLMGINIAFGITALFVDIFTCHPVAYFYNKFIPGGKCIDMPSWYYFASSYLMVMCFLVVSIPIAALKDLQIPRSQKRALMGVFALGSSVCAMSCFGVYATYSLTISHNYPRDGATFMLWMSLEMNIAIVCISLPPLKALSGPSPPGARMNRAGSDFGRMGSSHSNMTQLQQTKSNHTEITVKRSEPDPWAIP